MPRHEAVELSGTPSEEFVAPRHLAFPQAGNVVFLDSPSRAEEPLPREILIGGVAVPLARTREEREVWNSCSVPNRMMVVGRLRSLLDHYELRLSESKGKKISFQPKLRKAIKKGIESALELAYPEGELRVPVEVIMEVMDNPKGVIGVTEALSYERQVREELRGKTLGQTVAFFRHERDLIREDLAFRAETNPDQVAIIELDQPGSMHVLGKLTKYYGWQRRDWQWDLLLANLCGASFEQQPQERLESLLAILPEQIEHLPMGTSLQLVRSVSRFTQAEVGRRAGIDRKIISDMECGARLVGIQSFGQLLHGYGLRADDELSQILFQTALNQPARPFPQ